MVLGALVMQGAAFWPRGFLLELSCPSTTKYVTSSYCCAQHMLREDGVGTATAKVVLLLFSSCAISYLERGGGSWFNMGASRKARDLAANITPKGHVYGIYIDPKVGIQDTPLMTGSMPYWYLDALGTTTATGLPLSLPRLQLWHALL